MTAPDGGGILRVRGFVFRQGDEFDFRKLAGRVEMTDQPQRGRGTGTAEQVVKERKAGVEPFGFTQDEYDTGYILRRHALSGQVADSDGKGLPDLGEHIGRKLPGLGVDTRQVPDLYFWRRAKRRIFLHPP